jgi:hypothetical protein
MLADKAGDKALKASNYFADWVRSTQANRDTSDPKQIMS